MFSWVSGKISLNLADRKVGWHSDTNQAKQFYQSTVIDLLISFLHLLYCVLPLPDDFLPFMVNSAKIFSCLVELHLLSKSIPMISCFKKIVYKKILQEPHGQTWAVMVSVSSLSRALRFWFACMVNFSTWRISAWNKMIWKQSVFKSIYI